MQDELSFYEDEALLACVQAGLVQVGIPAEVGPNILARIDPGGVRQLNAAIVEACRGGLSHAEVEIIEDDPADVRAAGHDMHFVLGQKDGRPTKLLFIRVWDALPTIGIQLVGLAIAVATGSKSGFVNALTIIKTIYDHLATLKSPGDDDAIAAFRALLGQAIVPFVDGNYNAVGDPAAKPRYADLHEFGGPAPGTALKALKRLREIKVADVAQWGGVPGDIEHPDNRWSHLA
jgi:hypothetical protein